MKFPLRDWITGFVLERCSRAFEPKPIVAYLYNGVRLPALPEWDREAYPFVVIRKESVGYGFYCAENPYKVENSDIKDYRYYFGVDTKVMRYTAKSNSESWSFSYESTFPGTSGQVFNKGQTDDIVWSNHAIPNTTERTSFLEASTPVPVYE